MGKLFQFGSSGSTQLSSQNRIVKRTSQFIQKKASKFTQQAYYFQQPRRSPSFYQSLFSLPSSSILPSTDDEEKDTYASFRQAYTQFLSLNQLDESEQQPKSWKEAAFLRQDPPLSLNPAQLQFQELLYEVILTEKTYVHDLTLAYKIFAEDALTWSELPKPLKLIFDNLHQIIRLHLGLLHDLRRRQEEQHPILRTIADLFLSYTPRFLSYYSAYFVHFETANDVVVRSMATKSDSLGNYLKTRSAWPECRNLTLQSFLLKPVQRLMKYPLFFKSLSEALPAKDPGRIDHLRTLHELKSVIHRIELDKKEYEDFGKLEDLASRITGFSGALAQKNRRLIYEGHLTLLPHHLQRSITKDALGSQQYTYLPSTLTRSFSSSSLSSTHTNINTPNKLYVFLFNDMILCTKIRSKPRTECDIKPGNTYGPTPQSLFKLIQPPGQVTFIDRNLCRSSPINPESTMEEHPHQFICSIAIPHIITYHFETEEKKLWCDHLDSVLESHAHTWQPTTTTHHKLLPSMKSNTKTHFDPMSVFTPRSTATAMDLDLDDDDTYTSWHSKPLPSLQHVSSLDSLSSDLLHFTTAPPSPI
ncbi:Dbl homology domain-containing protein [Chlamydoabsidia padenii]|nr:Dbl homology domain-containing protein [Chlamydoabsidia padenii]